MAGQVFRSMMIGPAFDIVEDPNAHYFGYLPSGNTIVPFRLPTGKESRGSHAEISVGLRRQARKAGTPSAGGPSRKLDKSLSGLAKNAKGIAHEIAFRDAENAGGDTFLLALPAQ